MSKPGISISDARMPSTSFFTVPPTENFPFAPLPTADPNAAPIAVPTAPIAWLTLVGDVGADRDGDAGDNACVVVALADRDGDARDGACVVVALADLLAAWASSFVLVTIAAAATTVTPAAESARFEEFEGYEKSEISTKSRGVLGLEELSLGGGEREERKVGLRGLAVGGETRAA